MHPDAAASAVKHRARLRDGSEVEVRPLRPDDGPRLVRLFDRLSPQTVHRRFLSPIREPSAEGIVRLLDVDHEGREAVVAVAGDEIRGVARYARLPEYPQRAEVAVVVEDGWQGRGMARLLLRLLTAAARRHGIQSFEGTILSENRPIVRVLSRIWPSARFRVLGTETLVEIPLRRGGEPAAQAPSAGRESASGDAVGR